MCVNHTHNICNGISPFDLTTFLHFFSLCMGERVMENWPDHCCQIFQFCSEYFLNPTLDYIVWVFSCCLACFLFVPWKAFVVVKLTSPLSGLEYHHQLKITSFSSPIQRLNYHMQFFFFYQFVIYSLSD